MIRFRDSQYSPISQLPLELFVDIISLVSEPRPAKDYSNAEIPRRRKNRPNALFTCMRVCRSWRQLILSTPRFWSTLSIDGVINSKNAERKAVWIAQRASGADVTAPGEARPAGSAQSRSLHHGRGGIQRLVITAAQELPEAAFETILKVLETSGSATTLREVVCSFADGQRTTVSVQGEATRSSRLVRFLHEHARERLQFFGMSTGGRIYPDFDLGSFFHAFPRLEALNLRGSALSPSIVGINVPFLRPSMAATTAAIQSTGFTVALSPPPPNETLPPPTRARHLAITGAVFVSDVPCHLASFPNLEHLELDVVGAGTPWQLLSARGLKTYRATLYGESHVVELPIPDLAAAWAQVEDIRLGGAKRFASRLLQEAIRLGPLRFNHLRALDLSFASLTNEQLGVLFNSTNAPVLETLVLASTTASPPEVQLVLPDRLDALKRLDISHTAWVTDRTVRGLIKSAPMIEALEVRGNVALSGRPLMELVRSRACPETASAATDDVVYSEVTTLALEGCTKIETPAVEWLKKHIRPGGVKFQFIDPSERRSSYCY